MRAERQFDSLAEYVNQALNGNDVVLAIRTSVGVELACMNYKTRTIYGGDTERQRRLNMINTSDVKVNYVVIGEDLYMRVHIPSELRGLPLKAVDFEEYKKLEG